MRPGPRATPQKEELSGRVDNPPPRAHNPAVNLRLLGTLLLGHLTTDLAQGMIPALLPFFIAERGLSYAAAGGPVLAATVASSIVQPVFGYFADRRPSPWLVPAGVVTAGVGVALAGVAPSYSLIAASVALHGLGVAAFHPEGARAAAFASGTKRATGMSLFSTGGNLGMATGPLVITPLVLAFGLRATLAPLLPVVLVAAFLSTQTGRLAALRPHAHGPASAATDADRWGPFGRLAVFVAGDDLADVDAGQRPPGRGQRRGHPDDVLLPGVVMGHVRDEFGDLVAIDRVVDRVRGSFLRGDLANHVPDLVVGQRCAAQQGHQRHAVRAGHAVRVADLLPADH